MSRLERWSLHVSALLTGATGLLYGWLRYFGQSAGEFGPEPQAIQGLLQHLHVLAAPLLTFALGMVVRGHLLPMWRSGRTVGRISGLFVALVLTPMIFCGYAVQVATGLGWRTVFAWGHGLTSLLFLSAYFVHLIRTWSAARTEGDRDLDAPLA